MQRPIVVYMQTSGDNKYLYKNLFLFVLRILRELCIGNQPFNITCGKWSNDEKNEYLRVYFGYDVAYKKK